jgi:predicted  nucleic acid-binding Zn-ribbon protein
MSYRVRYTFPDGRSGLWTRTYATREEAQRLIGERLDDTGFAYVVEEVVATAALPDATPEQSTPEARIRELEAELAHLRDAYDAARQDLDVARRSVARLEETLAASRQGPAKASEAPGEGHDSGEGEK